MDSNTYLFFAGLTQSLSHVTVEHIAPFLFEIQAPDKINSVLSSSDRTLNGGLGDPFPSYSVRYVLAVTHCKWEVHMLNITSDIVHCFCREVDRGQYRAEGCGEEYGRARVTVDWGQWNW